MSVIQVNSGSLVIEEDGVTTLLEPEIQILEVATVGPQGPAVSDGDKGDIVVSNNGTTWEFDSSVVTPFARTFLDDADEAAFKATVNLEIGVDVQAWHVNLDAWAAVNPSSYYTKTEVDAAFQPLDANLDAWSALDPSAKQDADATLTALAGVTTAADKLIYATGVDQFATTDLTSFARSLLDDLDAATARSTLGAAASGANSDITSLTALESINGGPLGGFRNKIINGNFDIWQRGTNFLTPPAWTYTADRWRVTYDGNIGSFSITRKDFPLGQTDVPGNPAYYLRWNQMVAPSGTTFSVIATTIEDVRTFADETVTLTFYAAANKAMAINVGITQHFGTGGSPSADVFTSLGEVALGTTWRKFSIPVKLPSISGKTIGTNGNDCLVINVFLPMDTTFIFDLARVSLVAGDATAEDDPFSPRHIQQEIALCQRYFCKSYSLNVAPASITLAGSIGWFASGTDVFHSISFRFPVEMRVTPSISIYSPATGAIGRIRDVTGNADVIGGTGDAGTGGARIGVNNVSLTNVHLRAHYVADAEL